MEWLRPLASDVAEQVAPAAKAAAAATSGPRERAVNAARGLLGGVRLPSKPVLLLCCFSALKYGLMRTAIVAVAAQIIVEMSYDATAKLRAATRRRRDERSGVVDVESSSA